MRVMFLAAALAVVGCHQIEVGIRGVFDPPRHRGYSARAGANQTTDEDKASWTGVPITELETHPTFAALPKRTAPAVTSASASPARATDASKRIVYLQCTVPPAPRRSTPRHAFLEGLGRSGGSRYFCCEHDFLERGGVVDRYEPHGAGCGSGCSVQPQGRGSCAAPPTHEAALRSPQDRP